jgi:hypothetical protein
MYVGCDPNPDVYAVYKTQCVEYETILGNTPTLVDNGDHFVCTGSKTVKIYNLPSEDVDWKQFQNTFDL